MSFTKIRNVKIDNVVRMNGSCFIDDSAASKLFNAHKEDFKDFKVDKNLTLEQVFLLMSKHLISKDVIDFVVTIKNEYSVSKHRIDPCYKIKAFQDVYQYAKIDLYAIYKERKNTEIFEVLCFILKILNTYINFPSIEHDFMCMDMEVIRENLEQDCGEDIDMQDYLGIKEYDKIIFPFESYVSEFKKEFSVEEIFKIIPKQSYWREFCEDVLEFLKNPSSVGNYTYYFDNEELGYDYNPLDCTCYWGFTWESPGYHFQEMYVKHIDYHSRETIELPPLITVNLDENISEQEVKMRHLLKFLNKHNAYKKRK